MIQAIAIAPEATPEFTGWVDRGRTLAGNRREVDWAIGDWMMEGREAGFIDQAGFDFLADNLGIAPKRLRDISRAVDAFPSHLRDQSLSIEHHASVAALPRQDALQLLNTARDKHWTPERTRHEAHQVKEREGRPATDSYGMLESFIRHWNRLPKAQRLEAADMIRGAKGEEIEP